MVGSRVDLSPEELREVRALLLLKERYGLGDRGIRKLVDFHGSGSRALGARGEQMDLLKPSPEVKANTAVWGLEWEPRWDRQLTARGLARPTPTRAHWPRRSNTWWRYEPCVGCVHARLGRAMQPMSSWPSLDRRVDRGVARSVRYRYALVTVTCWRGVSAAAPRPPRASPELFDAWKVVRATPTFRAECW